MINWAPLTPFLYIYVGAILDYREVSLSEAGSTAKNSTSLRRAPGPKEDSVKGGSGNFPFWPGGFDDPETLLLPPEGAPITDDAAAKDLFDPGNYADCPPGFVHGYDFSGQVPTSSVKESTLMPELGVINLASVLKTDEDELGLWSSGAIEPEKSKPGRPATEDEAPPNPDLDAIVPEDMGVPVLNIVGHQTAPTGATSTEWAEIVDISLPMSDFHIKVPQMAYTWPFELDTFQKQAVWRLENNESVFVAAHTSAGKTVVAEYAIALSQKHMTRTIYTSPIKALSNQKFRDFKDTFNDVGLVTGDIQINPTATCLIMTTEILRSMLYNGSDIIRDLEYVIFDEVHYINDSERGVVWEEVLILLPDHVNIIMLSATVPNTLMFADWVGRTKRKKIYVISTLKRPVPLEHFLYTGSSGKTKDERFLLQDAQGTFRQEGYLKAVMAKKERECKSKQQYGAKGVKDRVGPQQEKNIWITLVDHLSRKDKLPVVAFTLSRNRCDQNANLLTSLDLTSSIEKGDIHHFINKCVARLKGTDRKLPQVLQLTELLKRGIGIHHSGILPILKEVVEMLFQRGWVKLLFATETFAMGVNMPARTVVFDNIKKHDGKQFRTLLPAEYIQMAGRAGRRGLDSTGTVIILCKNEVYDMTELYGMMQGKQNLLESKFRLTYSMILNLLRVEQLRVEDMIKRSFSEIDTQKKQGTHKEKLAVLKEKLSKLPKLSGALFDELESFYSVAADYLELKSSVWTLLLSHPVAVKMMIPGRVLLIKGDPEATRLGMLLRIDTKSREKTYSILVLDSPEDKVNVGQEDRAEGLEDFLALASHFPPSTYGANCQSSLVQIKDSEILEITNKLVKTDGDKILKDLEKRQIPRFKNDPPGKTTMDAIPEIVKVLDQWEQKGSLDVVNFARDFKVQDFDLLGKLGRLNSLKDTIEKKECCTIPDFREQFQKLHQRMKLIQDIKDLEYLLSEASLNLLPDYHNRIEVLKSLKYIDENSTVQLKGRVACEMGSHELMITELVFDNVLTDRPPAEIAALLSCMVFQQRNCSAPELTKPLEKGIQDIKRCAEIVGKVQKECGMIEPVQDYVDQFNFGLVEVVFEWARGMPFAEITQLTDVQEGVIVRTIQRLDEALRDVKDAARVIGDPVLYQKMDESSSIIKRDIVFAASLYTQ